MSANLPIPDEISTLLDALRWGQQQFETSALYFGHGTDNALDEALWLATHTLGLPFEVTDEDINRALDAREKRAIVDLYRQRIETCKPAAYLINEAWFCGLSFYVDERVLIPRSPIAELIESRFEPWVDSNRVNSILDLCAGSGCIGIACGYSFEDARVDLAELSNDALEVAMINIARHDLQSRVHTVRSDVYSGLAGRKYDLIVSNPPYVDNAEMSTLPGEYQHEPEFALAAGEDGLLIVNQILKDAAKYLNPDGVLVVEVGNSEQTVVKRYSNVPFVWLDFEYGGGGVLLLTAEECRRYF